MESRYQQEEGFSLSKIPSAPRFAPGDRVRLRATGEYLTVDQVVPSWNKTTVVCESDDPDSDWRICTPGDLEPVGASEDSRYALIASRVAAAVAACGRSDAALAERLGMDALDFRWSVDGRRDWLVCELVALATVLGRKPSEWFA